MNDWRPTATFQALHLRARLNAGIRDFLNNSLGVNVTVGGLMAKHQVPFGVYDQFKTLTHGTSEAGYDFTEIDWKEMPKNLYVRYGDPDASASAIDKGDGRHGLSTPMMRTSVSRRRRVRPTLLAPPNSFWLRSAEITATWARLVSSSAVQAILEVFPAEIRDVEEM